MIFYYSNTTPLYQDPSPSTIYGGLPNYQKQRPQGSGLKNVTRISRLNRLLPKDPVWAWRETFSVQQEQHGVPRTASSQLGICNTVGTYRRAGHCHRRPGTAQSKARMEITPGEIARTVTKNETEVVGKLEEMRVPLPSQRKAKPLFIPPPPGHPLLGRQTRAAVDRQPETT